VKYRGFRIELEEIDHVISEHPDVAQNLTIVMQHKGEKLIVSFFTSVNIPTEKNLAKTILDLTRQRLPPYMVPSEVSAIEVFPLTPNGKIDRNALAALL
jgi:acyl-coenzyme A synthetase/AMP-(fatty) acid ligase